MRFEIEVLDAGPVTAQPCDATLTLPQSPAERIVNAEMRQLARLMQLRLLTVFDIYNALMTVANLAQAAK